MRMNKLGRTGLFVSELCLGTMTFGGSGEVWSKMGALNQMDAERLIAAARDAGVNFIDTADVYSEGLAETITGKALRALAVPRDQIVIATKGYGPTGKGPNACGNSRLHLIDAVKASLKRLQLDHIDLYQVHGFDPATSIEETMEALTTLVQHGHVRYVGVSNWAAWQIVKALGISERMNIARFASLQAYYTLAGRDLEREIAPMLKSEGLGLLVWSPLAGGFLSGKYRRGADAQAPAQAQAQAQAQEGRRVNFDFPPVERERGYGCIEAMEPMAKERGVSVAQIALAWLLHQKIVTSVILGARKPEQLEDNLKAAEVRLTEDELRCLDEASALPKEYPGWMFERQAVRANLLAAASRDHLK